MTNRLTSEIHVAGFRGVPQIVAALEDEIVSGRWQPGVRLPSERVLAERFEVARSAIREALRILQERQLIVTSGGRGTFVREFQPALGAGTAEQLARSGLVSARDLIAARVVLEPAAAALAARNRSTADLRRLQELVSRFDTALIPEAADLDLEFHTAIVEATGNPVLQVMFASIRTLAHAMMARSLSDPRVVGADLHDVLYDRIAAQDEEGARAAMLAHIHAAESFYGADLDRPLADVLRGRADLEPRLASILQELSQPPA